MKCQEEVLHMTDNEEEEPTPGFESFVKERGRWERGPIDGLPDEIMKRLLEIVFKNVGMVKLPSTGAWTLTKKRLTRKEFAFAKEEEGV